MIILRCQRIFRTEGSGALHGLSRFGASWADLLRGLLLPRCFLNYNLLMLAGDAYSPSNLLLLLLNLVLLDDGAVETTDCIKHLSMGWVLYLTHTMRLLLLLLDSLLCFDCSSCFSVDRLWSLLLAHLLS